MTSTPEQETSLLTTPNSHMFFQNEEKERKIISSGLVSKEKTGPTHSILVGHGYFQHAETGCK